MIIQKEAYIIPKDHQFLFVPVKKDVFLQGVKNDYIPVSNLEKATLDYDVAVSRLSELAPKQGSLVMDTPLILVFQDNYGGKIPQNNLKMSQYIAMLYGGESTEDNKAFAIEMDSAIDKSRGIDFFADSRKMHLFFNRMTVAPSGTYKPDISHKIEEYNSVAQFYQRNWGDPKIIDGELIPRSVASVVENVAFSSGLPENASFQDKWDYVMKHFPKEIPGKEKREEIFHEEFRTSAVNLRLMADVVKGIRAQFGLTDQESGLLNGLNLVSRVYSIFQGIGEASDILDGGEIITPKKVHDVLRKIDPDYSPIIVP